MSQLTLVLWSAVQTKVPNLRCTLSQKCEMSYSSWPWLGSRAPKWNLERAWIDCHWRFWNMMSAFLLLFLTCVDRGWLLGEVIPLIQHRVLWITKDLFLIFVASSVLFPRLWKDSYEWSTHIPVVFNMTSSNPSIWTTLYLFTSLLLCAHIYNNLIQLNSQ